MTRKDRRAINRANATHSTGPVTETGKQTSSLNATTHGLTAMKPYLPTEERDHATYAAARLRCLNPQTETERDLADTVIDIEWRLKRIPSLEARLFESEDDDPHKVIRSLDVLSRHELRLRKHLQKTLVELEAAIQTRPNHQPTQALTETANTNGFVLKSANSADTQGSQIALENALNTQEIAAAA